MIMQNCLIVPRVGLAYLSVEDTSALPFVVNKDEYISSLLIVFGVCVSGSRQHCSNRSCPPVTVQRQQQQQAARRQQHQHLTTNCARLHHGLHQPIVPSAPQIDESASVHV